MRASPPAGESRRPARQPRRTQATVRRREGGESKDPGRLSFLLGQSIADDWQHREAIHMNRAFAGETESQTDTHPLSARTLHWIITFALSFLVPSLVRAGVYPTPWNGCHTDEGSGGDSQKPAVNYNVLYHSLFGYASRQAEELDQSFVRVAHPPRAPGPHWQISETPTIRP